MCGRLEKRAAGGKKRRDGGSEEEQGKDEGVKLSGDERVVVPSLCLTYTPYLLFPYLKTRLHH